MLVQCIEVECDVSLLACAKKRVYYADGHYVIKKCIPFFKSIFVERAMQRAT